MKYSAISGDLPPKITIIAVTKKSEVITIHPEFMSFYSEIGIVKVHRPVSNTDTLQQIRLEIQNGTHVGLGQISGTYRSPKSLVWMHLHLPNYDKLILSS